MKSCGGPTERPILHLHANPVDPAVGLDFSLLNALEAGALTFGKMSP